jgi:hypothetical protein
MKRVGLPEAFWIAVAERSGDTAFSERAQKSDEEGYSESGVALRFPPQSKASRVLIVAVAQLSRRSDYWIRWLR